MPLNPQDMARERLRIKREMGIAPEAEAGTERAGTDNQAREFDHSGDVYFGNSVCCNARVAFHCSTCKVKVTKCTCDLAEMVEDVNRERALKQAGLWLPR